MKEGDYVLDTFFIGMKDIPREPVKRKPSYPFKMYVRYDHAKRFVTCKPGDPKWSPL